ncbi:MAG: c-type cytochrome domain-containing protein, partial [Steroidobacteraceae bacterium]
MHFIYFLGRFHVLAVHLPITLVLVVAALEWLTRRGKRPDLQPALALAWPATALTAILTVILGYMHFAEGGFHGPVVEAHRALGTSIAVVALVGWILRSRATNLFQKARSPIVVLLVALVVVTGHLGGTLTHGSGYLTQYAPNFIRGMLGLAPSGPRLVTIAAADPYVDVIRPVLEQRCSNCHNSNKQKGGLNLSSYASLMKGGGDGPVIVKGNAQGSALIRRISLPQTSNDYMPKGKSPLTADQIAVFRWWVNSGAKTGVKVLALNPPQNIQTFIQDELHPPAGGAAAGVAQQPNAAKNNAIE